MLEQCEGSHAVAAAVALSRPEVICAYPISPQTHIVEGLGEMVKSGALSRCEFINVESEFAAMSVAIGASAAGAHPDPRTPATSWRVTPVRSAITAAARAASELTGEILPGCPPPPRRRASKT